METIQRMTARSILSFGSRRKTNKARSSSRDASGPSSGSSSNSSFSPKTQGSHLAPHPIPAGSEGRSCPISGLFADGDVLQADAASKSQLLALQADPDMAEELQALSLPPTESGAEIKVQMRKPVQLVHFNAFDGKHRSSSSTAELVREVGYPALARFTRTFYAKCFADAHVDQFIANHDEPHHERFALWIQEKFGDGTPWTQERHTRPKKYMKFGRETVQVAHDRSSAHFAAWHSPKRTPEKWGDHFKPDDARVWMRLHFWAARETGMFEHEAFMEYYIRFIGHFISVYSSKAPPFTRESVRWSQDPNNVQQYLDAGRMMMDVIGKDADRELAKLPVEERVYTGSRALNPAWPYEQRR
jgi:hypothetical protein